MAKAKSRTYILMKCSGRFGELMQNPIGYDGYPVVWPTVAA